MRRVLQKIIVLLLIIALVVPATLFSQPKKADAIIDCMLGQFLGTINSAVGSAASALAVPVHDMAHAQVSGQNYAQNASQTMKECVLDFLVNTLANTMIQQFTNSVVNWINNGFHGSPSFVTNPEGFFMEVGDIAIGKEIEQLGAIGELLCSGFDLDLRLALGFQYSTSRKEYIGCRLSDVQQNLMNTFTGGSFGGDAGWNRWFSIHSDPRNNPYGSYIRLVAQTDRQILKMKNRKLQELTQGRGFLSYKKCPSPDGSEAARQEDLQGKCQVVTPGSVIENQLNSHLGSGTRRIEVADEINEIIGALVNQALTQVMGATGLSGGSSRSYGGGRSYTSQITNTQQAYEQELAIQTARSLPTGITITCEIFEDNSYEVRPKTGGGTEVWVQTPIYNGAGTLTGFNDPMKALKADDVPWSDVDLRTVDAYCRNQAEQKRLDQYADVPELDFSSNFPTVAPTIPNYNLALRKPTLQSSTYRSGSSPYAVDGTPTTWSIAGNDVNSWWEVHLERRSFVDYILIHVPPGETNAWMGEAGPLRVEIYDLNDNGVRTLVKTVSPTLASVQDPIPWKISVGAIGRYVRLTRTSPNRGSWTMTLPEVEVMGRDSDVAQAGTTSSTETPLQLILEPQTQEITMGRGMENINNTTRVGTITLTTNKPLTKTYLSATFKRRGVLHEFGQVFDTAALAIVKTSGTESTVVNHTIPQGTSSSNTPEFALSPGEAYEIRPIFHTKSLTLFENYELKLEIKNQAGAVLGTEITTIRIAN